MVPHLGHTERVVVVMTAGVYMQALVKDTIHVLEKTLFSLRKDGIHMTYALNLRVQASTPSNHL